MTFKKIAWKLVSSLLILCLHTNCLCQVNYIESTLTMNNGNTIQCEVGVDYL